MRTKRKNYFSFVGILPFNLILILLFANITLAFDGSDPPCIPIGGPIEITLLSVSPGSITMANSEVKTVDVSLESRIFLRL